MREFDVTLTEREADLIIDLLLRHSRRCNGVSNTAIVNGYGKATSLDKAHEWKVKSAQAACLANKISERMI